MSNPQRSAMSGYRLALVVGVPGISERRVGGSIVGVLSVEGGGGDGGDIARTFRNGEAAHDQSCGCAGVPAPFP